MTRPIEAIIRPGALAANLNLIRAQHAGRRVWAVVKANAYGHGLPEVLSGLRDADGLALLEIEEAERARSLGWRKPILLLEGLFDDAEWGVCERLGLTPVVHRLDQCERLLQASPEMPIYIKINTGMNRLGMSFTDAQVVLERLLAQRGPVGVMATVTLMTHFADADADGAGVEPAWSRFAAWRAALPGPLNGLPMCAANSAAMLHYPHTGADWVRAGIALYGSSPFVSPTTPGPTAMSLGLRPVMTLRAAIIATQHLRAGDRVGYGATFTAPHDMRIGVVCCGYADGYPRIARGAPVSVGGVMTRLVGRVSMDMLTVDLEPCPIARVGTQVELWGEQVSIDAVAATAGTVGYELMCALAPRVPKRIEYERSV